MKRMKFCTICLVLAWVPAVSVAAPSGSRQRLADYFAALNRYDFEACLTFYAADAVTVHGNERTPFDRKVGQGYREFEAATHARFTYQIRSITGDTADVFETESNDFYKVLGNETHESHWAYRFREGLIYEEIQLSPPNDEYLKAYRALRAWIHRANPEVFKTVTSEDGNLVFNGRTAAAIMSLAREWRDTQGGSASPRTH
jgi:hypothetical protein